LLASVEVKVLYAEEVYLIYDLTKVKYASRRLLIVGMEKVMAHVRPINFKACKHIYPAC
jgi:hypothetical protein